MIKTFTKQATRALSLLAILAISAPDASAQGPICGVEMRKFDGFVPAVKTKPVPTTSFLDKTGAATNFAAHAGKTLVVNFWATWCAPCVEEMPSLNALQKKLKGDSIEVMAISLDRGTSEIVEDFYKRHHIDSLGIWMDTDQALTKSFGLRGLPTTIIVSREGRDLGRYEGAFDWNSDKATNLIKCLDKNS